MTTPNTTTHSIGTPTASGTDTSQKQGEAVKSEDLPPKSPKEIAREKFKAETAELVAKDAKAREKAERDASGRFTPKEEQRQEKAERERKVEQPETKQEAERKIWKLKVDGAEVDFDATDEEAVKRAVQKAHAADKRMNEASMTRKQAERFIELLKTNPRAVLEHPALGVDIKSLAEKVIWENMQAAAKTPDERAREAERSELEELRKDKARRDADTKQSERDQLKEKYRQDWSQKFQSELEKAGLPKSDWTLTRMASYMRQALSKGHKHVQPGDVVEFVREDWQSAQREMFGQLDGDALLEVLGDDTAEKVRKAQLARFQGKANEPEKAESDQKEPKRRYSTVEEMMQATQRRK